jgi:hypothetical protein
LRSRTPWLHCPACHPAQLVPNMKYDNNHNNNNNNNNNIGSRPSQVAADQTCRRGTRIFESARGLWRRVPAVAIAPSALASTGDRQKTTTTTTTPPTTASAAVQASLVCGLVPFVLSTRARHLSDQGLVSHSLARPCLMNNLLSSLVSDDRIIMAKELCTHVRFAATHIDLWRLQTPSLFLLRLSRRAIDPRRVRTDLPIGQT